MMIDIFYPDLEKLGISNIYTKCLCTAVVMFYLLCGERAKETSLQCFVGQVHDRMLRMNHTDMRRAFSRCELERFRDEVLGPFKEREAFFIMLTDNDLPHKDNPSSKLMFPGHVFVIEKKSNAQNRVYFTVYQSYINKYHLETYAQIDLRNIATLDLNRQMRKHMHYSYSRMKWLINNIINFTLAEAWTPDLCQFWKDFTLVNAMPFLNYCIFDYIYFCYRKLPTQRCEREMINMLRQKYQNDAIPQEHKNRVEKIIRENRV